MTRHSACHPALGRARARCEDCSSNALSKHVGALVIGTDTFFNSQSTKLGTLTRKHRLPAVYQYREFTAAGGLLSYAGSISDAYRTAGM